MKVRLGYVASPLIIDESYSKNMTEPLPWKKAQTYEIHDFPPVPNTSLSCSSKVDFLEEKSTLFLSTVTQFSLTFTPGSHYAHWCYSLGQFHLGWGCAH